MNAKIDLFILTARRLHLFKETISSFAEKNSDSLHLINKVWILDDRSSWEDRKEMSKFCSEYFGDKIYLVSFDSNRNFGWIDKFNFVGKALEADYAFLLEDDWKCLDPLQLGDHVDFMDSLPELTQIAFCDPLFVQEDWIRELYTEGERYWKNPWPESFRHVNKRLENGWQWITVRMNNYTNNPALTRSSVFKNQKFIYDRSFEHIFADEQETPLQFFATHLFFEHIGFEEFLDKSI